MEKFDYPCKKIPNYWENTRKMDINFICLRKCNQGVCDLYLIESLKWENNGKKQAAAGTNVGIRHSIDEKGNEV